MKRLTLIFIFSLLALNASANDLKLFKEYQYNMHKIDFQKKFRNFGECQFSMGENKLCAGRGYEVLYGIPFNITVYFDKNRIKTIKLKTADPIKKIDYLELFRGMIKSGFQLYEIKDQNGSLNLYEEILAGRIDSFEEHANGKLDALETENTNTNEATIYYMEHDSSQKALRKIKSITSFAALLPQLPKDIRFVQMKVNNYNGLYSLEIMFSMPNMSIAEIDDRQAEKF